MKLHNLKIKSEFFLDVEDGNKEFEVRYNDRDYNVGDLINFIPIDDYNEPIEIIGVDTNNLYRIKYILTDKDFPDGLKEGYVVLGIQRIWY